MDLSALAQLKISSNTDDDGNGTYGYLGNISIDADGDIAFVYTSTTSSTKDNVSISDSTEGYYLLTKDGKLSEIKAEIPGIKKTQHYEYDMSEDTAYGSAAVSDEAVAESETEDDGVVINDGENSDNNDDDSYNGIQTFKLKDADNLYVADYNGAVHHIHNS